MENRNRVLHFFWPSTCRHKAMLWTNIINTYIASINLLDGLYFESCGSRILQLAAMPITEWAFVEGCANSKQLSFQVVTPLLISETLQQHIGKVLWLRFHGLMNIQAWSWLPARGEEENGVGCGRGGRARFHWFYFGS